MSRKPSKGWHLRTVGAPEGGDEYQLRLRNCEHADVRVIREGDSWYYSLCLSEDVDEVIDSLQDYSSSKKAKLAAEWYLVRELYSSARRDQKALEALGYHINNRGRLEKV